MWLTILILIYDLGIYCISHTGRENNFIKYEEIFWKCSKHNDCVFRVFRTLAKSKYFIKSDCHGKQHYRHFIFNMQAFVSFLNTPFYLKIFWDNNLFSCQEVKTVWMDGKFFTKEILLCFPKAVCSFKLRIFKISHMVFSKWRTEPLFPCKNEMSFEQAC